MVFSRTTTGVRAICCGCGFHCTWNLRCTTDDLGKQSWHRRHGPRAQKLCGLWLCGLIAKGQSAHLWMAVGSCAMRLDRQASIPSACSAVTAASKQALSLMKQEQQGPRLLGLGPECPRRHAVRCTQTARRRGSEWGEATRGKISRKSQHLISAERGALGLGGKMSRCPDRKRAKIDAATKNGLHVAPGWASVLIVSADSTPPSAPTPKSLSLAPLLLLVLSCASPQWGKPAKPFSDAAGALKSLLHSPQRNR